MIPPPFCATLDSAPKDALIMLSSLAMRYTFHSMSVYSERFGSKLFVYPDAGEALQKELVTRFNAEQVIVRRGTLEDVFLRLTGRDLRE